MIKLIFITKGKRILSLDECYTIYEIIGGKYESFNVEWIP